MATDYHPNGHVNGFRPKNTRDASDDLISPHPLDTPDELPSSDYGTGTNQTQHSDQTTSSGASRRAEAFLKLPPEVVERYVKFPSI